VGVKNTKGVRRCLSVVRETLRDVLSQAQVLKGKEKKGINVLYNKGFLILKKILTNDVNNVI
jgi:hypothetical protein